MLAHPLAECIEEVLVGGRGLSTEERDAWVGDQSLGLLRPRRKRPRSCRAAEQRELTR
jgi:hypothetical protein